MICLKCNKEIKEIELFSSIEYECECKNKEMVTYQGIEFERVSLEWDKDIQQWKIVDK